MKLSVLIPVYNEEKTLEIILEKVKNTHLKLKNDIKKIVKKLEKSHKKI